MTHPPLQSYGLRRQLVVSVVKISGSGYQTAAITILGRSSGNVVYLPYLPTLSLVRCAEPEAYPNFQMALSPTKGMH